MKRKMVIAALSTSLIALAGPNGNSKDSEHINQLFAQAKTEAVAMQNDADQLKTYTQSAGASWQSHAGKLAEMKEHVNKAGEIIQKLNSSKDEASAWQETAVDRITPALQEMADNLQATIEELNKHQDRVNLGPYREYVAANADLAGDLSEIISDFVTYGKTKAKFEKLGQKLEVEQQP